MSGWRVPYSGRYNLFTGTFASSHHLNNPKVQFGPHTRALGYRSRTSGISSSGRVRTRRPQAPAVEAGVTTPAPPPELPAPEVEKCEPMSKDYPKPASGKCEDLVVGTDRSELDVAKRTTDIKLKSGAPGCRITVETTGEDCKPLCEFNDDLKRLVCGKVCPDDQVWVSGSDNSGRCEDKGTRVRPVIEDAVPELELDPNRPDAILAPRPETPAPEKNPCSKPNMIPDENGKCICKPTHGYNGVGSAGKGAHLNTVCLPCPEGATSTKIPNQCDCGSEYGIETLDDGFRCIPPNEETEGDTCIGHECDEVSPPVANLCEAIGVACDNKCRPGSEFKKNENLEKQAGWDGLSTDELTHARCIMAYMLKADDVKNFVKCPGNQKSRDNKYCLNSDYFEAVYSGFQDATSCFFNNEQDKMFFLSLLGHESRFQANALNTGDPSVAIGQTLYNTSGPVVDFDKDGSIERVLSRSSFSGCSDDACQKCESDFDKYYKKTRPHLDGKSYCASGITEDPRHAMYLAAAAFRNKRKAANTALVEGPLCLREGKNVRVPFNGFDKNNDGVVDDKKLLNRLASIAYNQGEGTLSALLCGFELASQTESDSHQMIRAKLKKQNGKVKNILDFNIDAVVNREGRATQPRDFQITSKDLRDIKAGRSISSKGFWKLQDLYYSKTKPSDNYYFKVIQDAHKIQDTDKMEVPKCSPDL